MNTRAFAKYLIPGLMLILLLSGVPACNRDSANSEYDFPPLSPPRPPSVAELQDPLEQKLQEFLTSQYGDFARVNGGWEQPDRVQPNRRIHRSVCSRHERRSAGQLYLWLAVCGTFPNETGAPGTIDFFILQENMNRLFPLQQALDRPFGTGNEVSVMAIGPHQAAFQVIYTESASRGSRRMLQALLTPNQDALVNVATLNYRFAQGTDVSWEQCQADKTGNCQKRYSDVQFDAQPDTDQGGAFHPLIVTEAGIDCGVTARQQYTLPFDETLFRYSIPAAITRTTCSGAKPVEEASPFEQMLAGLPYCDLTSLYYDLATEQPSHPYLRNLNLKPCSRNEQTRVVYYCVSENFHGLPVYQVGIPAGQPDNRHAVLINMPVRRARAILDQHFGSEFRESALSDKGLAPQLLEYPDAQRSVLLCAVKR